MIKRTLVWHRPRGDVCVAAARADERAPGMLTSGNDAGQAQTLNVAGEIDLENPFFQDSRHQRPELRVLPSAGQGLDHHARQIQARFASRTAPTRSSATTTARTAKGRCRRRSEASAPPTACC